MREFRRKPSQLAALSLQSRLVYTGYLLFLLVGLAVAAWLYGAGPGFETDHASAYYAGGEVSAAPRDAGPLPGFEPESTPPQAHDGGPALDLAGLDDPLDAPAPTAARDAESEAATELRPPMNAKHLAEITHGHLFVMPLVWLVIAHLFALVGLGTRLTGTLVVASGLGVALHIAAPWLVRDVATSLVWTLPVSGVLMLGSFAFMALAALHAMWAPCLRRRPTSDSAAPGGQL